MGGRQEVRASTLQDSMGNRQAIEELTVGLSAVQDTSGIFGPARQSWKGDSTESWTTLTMV